MKLPNRAFEHAAVAFALALASCGSSEATGPGSGGSTSASGSGTSQTGTSGTTGVTSSTTAGTTGASSAATGSSSSASSSASTGSSSSGSPGAAALAQKLGKPAHFLVGLGGTDDGEISTQGIKPDVFERYLVSLGSGAWPDWNSPSGAYVDQVVCAAADKLGAVPMLTLYQMATAGDGNIGAVINDAGMMTTYWAQTKLLFQRLAMYGKPALVNFEPDFWGYSMLQSTDPTKLKVLVKQNTDCASLTDDVAGFGACLVKMARHYAPKAAIGFPPSDWGFGTDAVVAYMKKVGAGDADFVVMQTLDGDAGCFEAMANTKCQRSGSGWYWDETNKTSPNFHDHLAEVSKYNTGLGKPIVWWQTPLGVASSTSGGAVHHFRDSRVHYFLTHASELVAAGGLAAVFSAGDDQETDITTDGGQFKMLSAAYLASPASL